MSYNRIEVKDFLCKLYDWSLDHSVSFTISYWESNDSMTLEIHSAAEQERFYAKRMPMNFDYFVEVYNKETKLKL